MATLKEIPIPEFIFELVPDSSGLIEANGISYSVNWQTQPPKDFEYGVAMLRYAQSYIRRHVNPSTPKKVRAEFFLGRDEKPKFSQLEIK